MKKLIISIFVLLTATVFGQTKNPKEPSIDIIYGQKFLSHKTFNGEINSIDNLKFGGNLSYIGIGMSSDFVVQRSTLFNHFGNYYYTQVIPQTIKVNDTITNYITGFNFGFTIKGFDIFPKQKIFNTYITIGINTGRLRMYGNSYTTQKNPYFSPKLRLNPTLTFNRIRISLQIEYEYDISKKNWRRTNFSFSDKIHIDQTSNTGLTLLANIGYILKYNAINKKDGIIID